MELLQFESLKAQKGIQHFISTREIGNLSFAVGDAPDRVQESREKLAHALSVTTSQFVFCKQIHGDAIVEVTAKVIAERNETGQIVAPCDAMVTQEKEIMLCVMVADCVPLIFYDPAHSAVAVAHAGWRGTAKRIAGKTILRMRELFGSKPEEILIGVGPAIGPRDFEVGPEVVHALGKVVANVSDVIRLGKGDRAYVNLWEANRKQLIESGVLPAHIEIMKRSTYSEPEHFFSARRDKKTGRFAAGIVVRA
jgi:YfiH family protein